MKRSLVTAAFLAVAAFGPIAQDRLGESDGPSGGSALVPTAHPPLPAQPAHYWYISASEVAARGAGAGAAQRLARGATLAAPTEGR